MVHICANDEDFVSQTSDRNRVFCVDFFAEWCGPCKAIAPFFTQLAAAHPDMTFLKVDIEKCENTAQRFAVRAVPTFIFLKGGQVLATVRGGNKQQLEAKIKEISLTASAKPPEGAPPGMADLTSLIDKTQTECLNESDSSPWTCALADEQGELRSDCDEQLILRTAFTQPIKLHSIRFDAGGDPEEAPKSIRMFVNETNPLSFDDAELRPATQELDLDFDSLNKPLPLRFVKFQKVNNLTLFIKDNQGDKECTAVSRIQFIGQSVTQTNMNEFKRVAGKAGEGE